MEPEESEAQPRIQCFQHESVVFDKLVVEELFGIVWSVTLDELILTCFAVVWTTEAYDDKCSILSSHLKSGGSCSLFPG